MSYHHMKLLVVSIRSCLLAVAVGAVAAGACAAGSGADGAPSSRGPASFAPHTRVSLAGDRWLVNETPTYRGTRAQGLLMNARMVNAVFEDRRKPGLDPGAVT